MTMRSKPVVLSDFYQKGRDLAIDMDCNHNYK